MLLSCSTIVRADLPFSEAVNVPKHRVDFSVDYESRLSPSALSAAADFLLIGQLLLDDP